MAKLWQAHDGLAREVKTMQLELAVKKGEDTATAKQAAFRTGLVIALITVSANLLTFVAQRVWPARGQATAAQVTKP